MNADVGREAVAAAEEAAFGGTDVDEPVDRDALHDRLDALVGGEWWRQCGPEVSVTTPRMSDRSSSARSCGDGVEIRLSSEQLTLSTVGHELAHALAGVATGHGPRFRAAYVDVMALLAGRRPSRRLAEAFGAFDLPVGARAWPSPWRLDGDGFRVVT